MTGEVIVRSPLDAASRTAANAHSKKRSRVRPVPYAVEAMRVLAATVCCALLAFRAAPVAAQDEATLAQFYDWFVDRGGSAPSLRLAQFPGMGTGIKAVADVKEGDVVISAPLSLVM